ncbi:hypothetical protein B0H17DRAFT_1129336 [Mycena rosella]|uniref:Bacteriophage T5 Orf172 DNA-binding domain-containing protein n=1 Tax=Mycena rosella TaxID=1033263 RepID=A0AAD7DUB0_MYCRO|nr:hypothetical protein B0H17DRAFT_1129336 [Mycena rosella]
MARAPSRRFRCCLAYLHRALRKPTPTCVVTAVSRARLSLSGNSLRHVHALRSPLDQIRALLLLGASAYCNEGPGVVYAQTRPNEFKFGHTSDIHCRLREYSACQRNGHRLRTRAYSPTPNRMLTERVVHLILNALQILPPTVGQEAKISQPAHVSVYTAPIYVPFWTFFPMSATPISVWYRGLTLKSGSRGVARESGF